MILDKAPLEKSQIVELRSLIAYLSERKNAFAIYKLPNRQAITLVSNLSSELKKLHETVEINDTGFVVAPFDSEKDKYIIEPELLISAELDVLDQVEESATLPLDKKNEILTFLSVPSIKEINLYPSSNTSPSSFSETGFKNYVADGVSMIRSEQLHKVVPARTKDVSVKSQFDWINAFNDLSSTYPSAFVSLISTKEYGTWLGATPEILVSENEHKIFRTTALAGTKLFEDSIDLEDVLWSQKEIEEQALVSRYIINCFKKIRLREFQELGPRTVRAGNLVHLKTDYSVDMKATSFPDLTSTMLKLLHPTSAVCGMPKEKAYHFIKKNEGIDRALFSGFLGPLQLKNETHLFVNLRCLSYHGSFIRLYAGAGLTADSKPEKEFKETEIKFDTLYKVLNKYF